MYSKELQYLLEIVKAGSLTKAADNLYTTQPSLSRMVANIELNLGVKLFDKTKTPWMLTQAGELYIRFAKNTLDNEKQFLSEIEGLKDYSKKVIRLAIMPFEERYYLSKMLPILQNKFKDKYKNLKIDIKTKHSKGIEALLISEEVDFAIIVSPAQNEKIKYFNIKEYKTFVVVNKKHSLAKIYKLNEDNSFPVINLKQLKDEEFVLLKKNHIFRDETEALCKKAGFSPKIKLEVANIEAAYALVKGDYGITFIMDELILRDRHKEDLCCFEIDNKDNSNSVQTIAIAYLASKKLNDEDKGSA